MALQPRSQDFFPFLNLGRLVALSHTACHVAVKAYDPGCIITIIIIIIIIIIFIT